MIIAICGQKGGTGKTTIATALSVEYCVRGRSTLLVDVDPQGSVRTWGDVAAQAKIAHAPTVAALGAGLHKHLPPLAAAHEVTLLDCPPGDGALQRAALMVSDVAILPCVAVAFETWALTASVALVKEAQAVHPHLRAAVVINRKQTRTAIGQSSRAVLAQFGLPVLDAELGQRVDYQEAPGAGQGPTTYAPHSAAAAEVRALATEIEELVAPPARRRRKR